MRHAAANAAAEVEDRRNFAYELAGKFNFVAGEIVAVAVEKIRLCGEDCLVLPRILVEIDARHGQPPHGRCDEYANKNNKLLRRSPRGGPVPLWVLPRFFRQNGLEKE